MDSPFDNFTWSEFDSGAMPDEVLNPDIPTHMNKSGKWLLTGSGEENMDFDFVSDLDKIRNNVGFAIPVTPGNGYRSDRYNKKVNGVSDSSHRRKGVAKVKAADLSLNSYAKKKAVAQAAIELGITRFGWGNGTLLHIDNDETKSQNVVWGYGGSHPSFNDLEQNLA